MRRISALLLASLMALVVVAPAFGTTTISFHAFVKETFGRAPSDVPCEFDEDSVTCYGSGNAGRYGQISSVGTFVFDGAIKTRIITTSDGSTLTLSEDLPMFWTPGNSASAPGALVSFGNPGFIEGTFEVIGGTGALAGAAGSGTIHIVLAGNTIQIWFDGTLVLP